MPIVLLLIIDRQLSQLKACFDPFPRDDWTLVQRNQKLRRSRPNDQTPSAKKRQKREQTRALDRLVYWFSDVLNGKNQELSDDIICTIRRGYWSTHPPPRNKIPEEISKFSNTTPFSDKDLSPNETHWWSSRIHWFPRDRDSYTIRWCYCKCLHWHRGILEVACLRRPRTR